MIEKKGYKFDAAKQYVEKLLKGVRSKPHPQHPRNKEMRLNRVLRSVVEGSSASMEQARRYKL